MKVLAIYTTGLYDEMITDYKLFNTELEMINEMRNLKNTLGFIFHNAYYIQNEIKVEV